MKDDYRMNDGLRMDVDGCCWVPKDSEPEKTEIGGSLIIPSYTHLHIEYMPLWIAIYAKSLVASVSHTHTLHDMD